MLTREFKFKQVAAQIGAHKLNNILKPTKTKTTTTLKGGRELKVTETLVKKSNI